MCGRYTLRTNLSELVRIFAAEAAAELALLPRDNIAPTETVPVVRATENDHRELVLLRWGLVSPSSQGPKSSKPLINARAETLAEKPSFRNAFRSRRCLIPADGFYEWKTEGRQKIQHTIQRPTREPFAFAGLWEHWQKDGQSLQSCTIITTKANTTMAPIHHRMPVIISPNDYVNWLNPHLRNTAQISHLLSPCDPHFLEADSISQSKPNRQKRLFV